ncbi:hypothetical protein MNBD_GAMMA17-638 [hydrothermal vent metagenome]|uniref:PABS domain-containing protein n=1 Tax=hydrothermal vent metagenome TaxID=652676 RepID=A0A3B1A6X9_9ZZZZ
MKTEHSMLISEETPWGILEVWQSGSVRSLYIRDKTAIQSQLDVAQKEKLCLQHARAMMSFLLFQDEPQSILLFGLGGGSMIHFLCHWFPDIKITAVDINEKMVEIGKKYFPLPETPRIKIEIADASTYLKKKKQKQVDVIFIDVHGGDRLPGFLRTDDFMADCFHALSPGGVLVINLLVKDEQEFTDILSALRQCFMGVSLCMTFKNQQNILLFAFKTPNELDLNQLSTKANHCQNKYGIEFEEFIDGIIKVNEK